MCVAYCNCFRKWSDLYRLLRTSNTDTGEHRLCLDSTRLDIAILINLYWKQLELRELFVGIAMLFPFLVDIDLYLFYEVNEVFFCFSTSIVQRKLWNIYVCLHMRSTLRSIVYLHILYIYIGHGSFLTI